MGYQRGVRTCPCNFDHVSSNTESLMAFHLIFTDTMCGPDLAKPLFIIYKNCLDKGIFPLIWKKANVPPIHKKDINTSSKTINPFLFFLSLVNY